MQYKVKSIENGDKIMKCDIKTLRTLSKDELNELKSQAQLKIDELDQTIATLGAFIEEQKNLKTNAEIEKRACLNSLKKIEATERFIECGNKYKAVSEYDIEPFTNREALDEFLRAMKNECLSTYLFCKIAATHGLRSVDILKMKFKKIKRHFDDNMYVEKKKRQSFVFREKKTSKYNQISFTDSEFEALKEYFEMIDRERIEINDDTVLLLEKDGKRLNYANVRRRLQKIKKLLGLEMNLGTHSFRKTFARICLDQGMPVSYVKMMMNHEKQEQTFQYAHYMPEDLKNVVVECA